MNDRVELVTAILSIGVIVTPVLFGYLLWRLSREFVRIASFDDYKIVASQERTDMRNTLSRIEDNLTKVMIGVARLEGYRRLTSKNE